MIEEFELAKAKSEIEQLSELVTSHDESGLRSLLNQHRERLKRMITTRLDPRIAARVDPSDVVQETLVAAVKGLPEYLKEKSLPVYPWLRQLAAERMSKLAQTHLHAQRRSVLREQQWNLGISDASVVKLAERVVARENSPSGYAMEKEQREQVRRALDQLSYVDREVLVMRFIEQLTAAETSSILGITPDAVRMRRLRALRALADELRKLN